MKVSKDGGVTQSEGYHGLIWMWWNLETINDIPDTVGSFFGHQRFLNYIIMVPILFFIIYCWMKRWSIEWHRGLISVTGWGGSGKQLKLI